MSGHTPGPWEVSAERIEDSTHIGCWIHPVASRGHGWVGDRYLAVSGIMAKADAHLIAAAPTMLDALCRVVEVIENYLECDPDSRLGIAVSDANAAIAKATGGAA